MPAAAAQLLASKLPTLGYDYIFGPIKNKNWLQCQKKYVSKAMKLKKTFNVNIFFYDLNGVFLFFLG